MFSLFQVKSGEMDVSDVRLVPTDPQPLIAAKEREKRQIAARFVPDEEPVKEKWPSELRVVGNRLRDAAGNEVWLQGVNAGGMESIPNTDQIVKSVVVAIDEWKSNCVRLPVNETFWFGTSPYQSDAGAAYRAAVDKIVTLAANRCAYVAIDLHRFRVLSGSDRVIFNCDYFNGSTFFNKKAFPCFSQKSITDFVPFDSPSQKIRT